MRPIRWIWRVALGLFVVYSPGVLAAPPPPPPPQSTQCTPQTPSNCLNGVSASVTSLDSMRVTGEGRSTRRGGAGAESDDEGQARLRPFHNITGQSAGDGLEGFGLWAGYSRSDFESTLRVAPFDANLDNVLVGMDTMPSDRLLLGVSLGYESVDVATSFNGGGQDVDGFSIAPYAAYLFNDFISADLTIGYAHLETDQNRVDPANGATLTSDFGADRVFAAANLNGFYALGNVVFGGRIGYLFTAESQDSYRERGGPSVRSVRTRHIDLGQGYIGLDIAYSLGDFEPYALGIYRNDFGRDDGSGAGGLPSAVGSTTPDDDDEAQLGLGLRYFGPSGLSGRFEWTTTQGRSLFDDDTFSFMLRMDL